MWTYVIKTGELYHDDALIGTGYSGRSVCKNVPTATDVAQFGPTPVGTYTIGAPVDTDTHGPHVMSLTPATGTQTFGRSGFLMHGDSIEHPGFASHGCIIISRDVRNKVSSSGDNQLTVVADKV